MRMISFHHFFLRLPLAQSVLEILNNLIEPVNLLMSSDDSSILILKCFNCSINLLLHLSDSLLGSLQIIFQLLDYNSHLFILNNKISQSFITIVSCIFKLDFNIIHFVFHISVLLFDLGNGLIVGHSH